MTQDAPLYFSYLLRIWQAADGEQPVWRASLVNPVSGERRGFASLEELFVFLRRASAPVPADGRWDEV